MDLAAFIKQERDIIVAFEDWWCEQHNAERRAVEKYNHKPNFPLRRDADDWEGSLAHFRGWVWPTLGIKTS